MASVPQSGGDGPMERQSHDEHQAAETLRIVDVGVLDAEAAGFEVGEHGFNAPAPAVFQGLQIPRLGRPGLADMAMIQGSACPGSWMMPILVRARLPVNSTFSR